MNPKFFYLIKQRSIFNQTGWVCPLLTLNIRGAYPFSTTVLVQINEARALTREKEIAPVWHAVNQEPCGSVGTLLKESHT